MDWQLLGFSGLKEVFNLHPVFVHFPIALFPAALLFFFLGLWRNSRQWLASARLLLYLAALSGILTVWTGLRAPATIPHNEIIHRMIMTHQTIGLVVLGLAIVLTLWSFWQTEHRPKAAWVFLAVLGLTSLLLLQNGDLGSRMVYVQGAAVKPAIPIIAPKEGREQPQHHHEHNHPH